MRDSLVFHEPDEQFIVGIYTAASGKYIFIRAVSGLSSETWVLDGVESNSGNFDMFNNRGKIVSKKRDKA